MSLTAVLVDDEELARQVLREFLGRHPDIRIVAECANGLEAVKAVGEHQPDLLLLDIQMPKLDGFEVLELIDPCPAVIFVTAYDTFAMKAFEVHAVDYLLKPFSAERFDQALARAIERLRESPPPAARLAAAARAPGRYLERIVVRDRTRVHVIPVERLDWVEAQDDYVSLESEGSRWLKQQTIAELEASLDPSRFVRIHRSYVVNLDRVARIESYNKDSRVAILTTGARLPVSRSGYARLRELLGER